MDDEYRNDFPPKSRLEMYNFHCRRMKDMLLELELNRFKLDRAKMLRLHEREAILKSRFHDLNNRRKSLKGKIADYEAGKPKTKPLITLNNVV